MLEQNFASRTRQVLCETHQIERILGPRVGRSIVGLNDLSRDHKAHAKWCGMLRAVPLPGQCEDARVSNEGSYFAVVRNAYDGWSPCGCVEGEENKTERKKRLLAWILLHAGIRPGPLVFENIEYLAQASLDDIANLKNTTSGNLQSVCSLSGKEADRLLEYVSSLTLKKQDGEEETDTIMPELEIFAWGNVSGDINFRGLGGGVSWLPRVCKRRFSFDERPQKFVTNGTNIMYLWRNSVSESDVMSNIARELSADVVDLNIIR